ncbi:hypothetical protein, partial [Cohnella nanjingensis]
MPADQSLFQEDRILTWMRDHLLRELVSSKESAKSNLKERMFQLKLNPYYTFPTVALIEPAVPTGAERERREDRERMREV